MLCFFVMSARTNDTSLPPAKPLTPASISVIPATLDGSIDSLFRYSRTATAYGCEERFSRPPARANEDLRCRPFAIIIAPIDGFPDVRVPVLSSST